jgi:hypothetical protein
VSFSQMAAMLANPFYTGVVEWDGVRYPGQHKPLIPQAMFERVQEVMRTHNVAGVRRRRHDHYLKGLLHCGACGKRLLLTLAKGTYLYFYCLGQRRSSYTGCTEADKDRITKEETAAKAELARTEADLGGWQEVLSLAIELAGNCHTAYLKANPKARRRFNDAVLESVQIADGRIVRAEFTEVFEVLFSRPSSNKALRWSGSESNRRPPACKASPVGIRYLDRRAHLREDQAFRLSMVGGVLHSSAPSHGTDTGRLGGSAREGPRWFTVIDLTLIRDAMGSSHHGVSKRSKSQLFQLEGVFDNAR